MSEQIKSFINSVYTDKSADAGEEFKDALRAKVGDALEKRRKEMSQNMFKAQQGEFEEAPHNEQKPEINLPALTLVLRQYLARACDTAPARAAPDRVAVGPLLLLVLEPHQPFAPRLVPRQLIAENEACLAGQARVVARG